MSPAARRAVSVARRPLRSVASSFNRYAGTPAAQDFHHIHHIALALALARQYDVMYVIYLEAIQPANLSRHREPNQDETGKGTSEHNGAWRKAGLNKSIHDAR